MVEPDPSVAAVIEKGADSYQHDELVVATPHVELVKRGLRELPEGAIEVRVKADETLDEERDDWLGLSLLRLRWVDKPVGADPIDVGRVLHELYDAFEGEFEGWAPTMGKNRFVHDQVIGGGSMSYGGHGDPQTVKGDGEALKLKREEVAQTRTGDTGAGVVIGMVDTAISSLSEPLVGGWVGGAEDILNPATLADPDVRTAAERGHATFVAGVILSVAPAAQLVVRGVLRPNGRADSWRAARAIADLAQRGVDILNLSFTCLTGDGKPPLALATAIGKVPPTTLIVAAAGNHGDPEPLKLPATIDGKVFDVEAVKDGKRDVTKAPAYPAALDSVVAVGAFVENDGKAARTAYTPKAPWLDVLASGNAISTFLTDPPYHGFASWQGTSFAAAFVTGAVAARTKAGHTSPRRALEELVALVNPAVVDGETLPIIEPEQVWSILE